MIEVGKTITVKPQTLTRMATDAEIEDPVIGMGPSHLFGETVLCGVIAGLIARQPKGEEGALLNNGYANLFYLGSCVVDVGWGSGGREWGVNAWRRGDDGWDAGGQVFSPATEA